MKAISTVIAALLMLIITIALAGFAYTYISGVLTQKTAEPFSVADTFGDTVTISNDGTVPITSFQRATLDGNPVNVAIVPNVDGLVGYWSFNEGSGLVAKDSVGINDGDLINGPTWVDGKYGKAIQFDGTTKYVSIAPASSLDFTTGGQYTFEAWIYPTEVGGGGGGTGHKIAGKSNTGNGFVFMIGQTSVLRISNTIAASDVLGATTLSTNTWYHAAFTKAGNTVRLYLNGIEDASGTIIFAANTEASLSVSSTGTGFWADSFEGIIDEVAIFNRALSESEVKQLFSGLILPGQSATIKPLTSLSAGTHTLRLCTSSSCNTAILTIT